MCVVCEDSLQIKRMCDVCDVGGCATSYCELCDEAYCDECARFHQRLRRTNSHRLTAMNLKLQKREPKLRCQVHEDDFADISCTTCLQLICRECAVSSAHSIHRIQSLKEAIDKGIIDLAATLKELETSKANVAARLAEARAEVLKVRREFDHEYKALKAENDRRMKKLTDARDAIQKPLEATILELEIAELTIASAVPQVCRMIEANERSQALQHQRLLVHTLELSKKDIANDPKYAVMVPLKWDKHSAVGKLHSRYEFESVCLNTLPPQTVCGDKYVR